MIGAAGDTRRTVQGLLLNWALWAILGNKIRLGYTLQSWQRLVKCGPGSSGRSEKDIDEDAADQVHRCYIYVRQYHPKEAHAGRVFYLDNFEGFKTPNDMARMCSCSVATFYRRKERFENRMARCLGTARERAVA